MKRILYIILAAAMLASCATSNQSTTVHLPGDASQATNDSERYILTYYPMAIEQMERHGIPASITLAQALLEGGAGRSDLVKEANNHFGVKADKRWQGKTYSKWDNGKWCKFRVYGSTRESFEDHSKFLVSNSRYDFLFELDKKDYKGWAKGLKKAGYAEDTQYHTRLINIIERYGLDRYDTYRSKESKRGSDNREKEYRKTEKKGSNAIAAKEEHREPKVTYKEIPERRELLKMNGLRYTVAYDGDTFAKLSSDLGISKRKIRKYNDLNKGHIIAGGDIIYLEKKNSKARRGNEFHTTRKGESLYDISQMYGIRLNKLYKMNPQYKEYTRLKVGDVIRLR